MKALQVLSMDRIISIRHGLQSGKKVLKVGVISSCHYFCYHFLNVMKKKSGQILYSMLDNVIPNIYDWIV